VSLNNNYKSTNLLIDVEDVEKLMFDELAGESA